eukprot:3874187-Amphidinium_carterae.1
MQRPHQLQQVWVAAHLDLQQLEFQSAMRFAEGQGVFDSQCIDATEVFPVEAPLLVSSTASQHTKFMAKGGRIDGAEIVYLIADGNCSKISHTKRIANSAGLNSFENALLQPGCQCPDHDLCVCATSIPAGRPSTK